jgi:anaerobic selenocysteine-containing dehydrogenase
LANHGEIRDAIGAIFPGWEKISEMDRTKAEFHIKGRRLDTPKFPTETGKARLHIHELPDSRLADDELRLMTVRSEGQFNTVVYEDYDLYRGQDRRDIVLMHPKDLAARALEPDQPVLIVSAVGSTRALAKPYEKIRPGNVLMYYPEANVLVPRDVDPASRTPAFKNVTVTIKAAIGASNRLQIAPEFVADGSSKAQMRSC